MACFHFKVGTELLPASGRVAGGVNVASARYEPLFFAEHVAFFNALRAGRKQFVP